MPKIKKIGLLPVVISLILLSGCWDQVEIENRVYVASIGIDKSKETDNLTEKYQVSFAFPNHMGGYGGEVEVTNAFVSTLASDVYMADRVLATRLNKSVYLGHLRMVLLGEEVAKDPQMLREILDTLERNPLVNRRLHIGIVEGKAADLMQMEPMMEKNLGQLLYDIFERKDQSQRMPYLDLGEVLIRLHNTGDSLIPRIVPFEKEVKVAGASIIKDFKQVGWLGERETAFYSIASGDIQFLIIPIPHIDMIIPMNITDGSTEYEYIETENERKIIIKLEMEGDIERFYMNPEEDILDPKINEELQKHAEKLVKEGVEATMEKLQKEFKADVLQLGIYLEKNEPKVWRELKADWEEIYQDLTIEAEVEVNIRRVGLSR